MALSITVNGAGTFTASMEEGPVSFSASLGAVPGPQGPAGADGPAGVVAATAPITYNSGTQTIGISATPTFTTVNTTGLNLTTATFADATSQTTAFVGEARRVYITARNSTGSTIAKGKVVYLSGGTGNVPNVSLALADAESTSSRTIGIASEAIANNSSGKVITSGSIENIDTSAFADGDTVYLSATTAGGMTTTLPTQPLHGVVIGIVTRANPSVGSIEVAINNYQELKELSDVAVSDRANNDGLFWESSSSTWRSKTIAEVLGYTPANNASVLLSANNLSDLGSASTARTNLGLGTMAVETASNYLTTTTAASTYQTQAGMSAYLTTASASSTYLTQSNAASTYPTQAGMSSYAPLASPTFSGTPSLPTGTTGITQTTGNSTTRLATTAFVQQEVPTASTSAAGKVQLATDAETIAGIVSTKAITPSNATLNRAALRSQDLILVSQSFGTTVTGGANVSQFYNYKLLNNTNVTGIMTTSAYSIITNPSRGAVSGYGIDWSKRISFSCRTSKNNSSPDANTVLRMMLGKSGTATGDLAIRGIGVKTTGSGALTIMAHNGSSLTTNATSYTPTNAAYDLRVESDGAGNVSCYVNDSLVGTSTGGPTTQQTSGGGNYLTFENENTASVTNATQFTICNPSVSLNV